MCVCVCGGGGGGREREGYRLAQSFLLSKLMVWLGQCTKHNNSDDSAGERELLRQLVEIYDEL